MLLWFSASRIPKLTEPPMVVRVFSMTVGLSGPDGRVRECASGPTLSNDTPIAKSVTYWLWLETATRASMSPAMAVAEPAELAATPVGSMNDPITTAYATDTLNGPQVHEMMSAIVCQLDV